MGRIVVTLSLLALLLGYIAGAKAHQAPSGWDYDPECCSMQDCSTAIKIEYLDGGAMRITTRHGTDIYPPDFPRRASKDDKVHACHMNGRKFCLYWPVEI
jgi:hypothetical protein